MARGLLTLLLGAGALVAQEDPAVQKTRAAIEAALAAQRKSLEAQRESVARQQEAARRFIMSPPPTLSEPAAAAQPVTK